VAKLVEYIVDLHSRNYRVILVTSGAVSIGCHTLNLKERPSDLVTKQAVAAVGQSRLMRIYDDMFSHFEQPIAQVLLSRENLNKRHHYENALNTFNKLLEMQIVPIVNENDTVAVEELRVGDNDTLSALVASLVGADYLFLLTDVDALYTADPRYVPDAKPIHEILDLDAFEGLNIQIGDGGKWGTGGMITKIQAARIACSAGVTTCIIKSTSLDNIKKIMDGELVGTKFHPILHPVRGHKKWIAHGLRPSGSLVLDDGAVTAVIDKKSLFAVGVTDVLGDFQAQSSVMLVDKNRLEIGRGVCNYSSEEMKKICRVRSSEISVKLGYVGPEEIVHRDSLAITYHSTSSIHTEDGK
jgi:glutamate 5-kinase